MHFSSIAWLLLGRKFDAAKRHDRHRARRLRSVGHRHHVQNLSQRAINEIAQEVRCVVAATVNRSTAGPLRYIERNHRYAA